VISLVDAISGESLKLLPPDAIKKLKCTKFHFGWSSAQTPLWEHTVTALPQTGFKEAYFYGE